MQIIDGIKTHVMIITMTFSQMAKFANQERRCRVRICPRKKPKSMKITSATMTVAKSASHSETPSLLFTHSRGSHFH